MRYFLIVKFFKLKKSGFKVTIAKWITLQLILAIVVFLVTLVLFVIITDEIVLEHESGFDTAIAHAVLSFRSPLATRFFKIVTFFGSSAFLFPAYTILIVIFLIKKKRAMAFDVIVIGITTVAILNILKEIFRRKRPLDPLLRNVTGFSFPSGHSFSSFTFFGLIAFLIWQTQLRKGWKVAATIFLFLFAASIAFSRVYLQVHFPSDVIAGLCLSIIWLIISIWLLQKIHRRMQHFK